MAALLYESTEVDVGALPQSVQDYINSMVTKFAAIEKEKNGLLQRNSELVVILSNSQEERKVLEATVKKLRHELFQKEQENATLLAAATKDSLPSLMTAGHSELSTPGTVNSKDDVYYEEPKNDNPYLSPMKRGSATYVAATAEDIIAGNVIDDFDENTGDEEYPIPIKISSKLSSQQHSSNATDDQNGFPAEVNSIDQNQLLLQVNYLLQQLFEKLLVLTGTTERVLGKAEFDLLGAVCGLEDVKQFRADLVDTSRSIDKHGTSKASTVNAYFSSRGLTLSEFVSAFTSPLMPVPGSTSVPSQVWKAVNATEMGVLLKNDKRRELFETELGRWNKALELYGESDGEYDDEDELDNESIDSDPECGERNGEATDEEYEPWDLGPELELGGVGDMRARFEILGKKRHGEDDLGGGRAGVVRKCKEITSISVQDAESHEGISKLDTSEKCITEKSRILACKIISKKQQSREETKREIDIMRRLSAAASHGFGILKLVEVFEAPERLFVISELCKGGEVYDEIIVRANMEPPVSNIEPFDRRDSFHGHIRT